jgi:hypothetical protein
MPGPSCPSRLSRHRDPHTGYGVIESSFATVRHRTVMPLHCGISEKWRPFAEAGVCDRRHTDEISNSLVPSGDRLRKPAFAIDGTQAKFSNDFSRAREVKIVKST